MPHFLIKKEEIFKDFIKLETNENLFHITKVLRSKKGEKIRFIDENKIVYDCIIDEISKNYLKANILKSEKSNRILNCNLCLIQCILAQDAQNLAIANATQTGVKEIYPVISDNVSQSLNATKNKISKWEKIVLENFKQCERADLAQIHPIEKMEDILKQFKRENILIFAEKCVNIEFENALKDIDKNDKIAVVIGPEGGFSQREFDYFIQKEYKLISLGNMIYKAPNAITAGISNVITRL